MRREIYEVTSNGRLSIFLARARKIHCPRENFGDFMATVTRHRFTIATTLTRGGDLNLVVDRSLLGRHP